MQSFFVFDNVTFDSMVKSLFLPQGNFVSFNASSAAHLQEMFWTPSLEVISFEMSSSWCLFKLHPLLIRVTSKHSCPVCSTSCLFEKVSVQKIFTVIHRHLLRATISSFLLSSDAIRSHTEDVHLTGWCYSLGDTAKDPILHNSYSDGVSKTCSKTWLFC